MKRATTTLGFSFAAMSALLASTVAGAADDKTARSDAPPAATYSDRAQMKAWSSGKEQLERELGVGQNKAFYVKALADRGFHITSINTDRPAVRRDAACPLGAQAALKTRRRVGRVASGAADRKSAAP